jgi:hypothetical protein
MGSYAFMCSNTATISIKGVGGTMFLQIMIINIIPLVHNQEEQKEEFNLVYTK